MASPSTTQADSKLPKSQKPRKPNYQQIHAQPLPIKTYPLPLLIPNNPLSLLHIAYVVISQYLFPTHSHPQPSLKGYWSPETRSVHVTGTETVRTLWEQGFFGKGSLSRSEPTWLETEKVRQGNAGKKTSEAMTAQRREERRRMKNERAVKVQEAIEETRRLEMRKSNGHVAVDDSNLENEALRAEENDALKTQHSSQMVPNEQQLTNAPLAGKDPNIQTNSHPVITPLPNGNLTSDSSPLAKSKPGKSRTPIPAPTADDLSIQFISRVEALKPTAEIPIQQEHLQLTPSEAFFLCYALGSLDIYPSSPTTESIFKTSPSPPTPTPLTPTQLLHIFLSSSAFPAFTAIPPIFRTLPLHPDDPFLLTYITYHHFRSLGWTPRPGLKFGCDFLLYPNGPAIEHAPFAVVILASYARDPWWRGAVDRRKYVEDQEKKRTWQWFHALNRVQSQVKKGVVICWVEVPGGENIEKCFLQQEEEAGEERRKDGGNGVDIGKLLGMYQVREMMLRRWSPNRARD